jgi:hypothetical protein
MKQVKNQLAADLADAETYEEMFETEHIPQSAPEESWVAQSEKFEARQDPSLIGRR